MNFTTYIPSKSKFCREYVAIKRNSLQLPIFISVVKGIKPVMDDWIEPDKYLAYKKLCKKYGLYVIPDVIFEFKKIPTDVIGREYLTTTKAYGIPFLKKYTKRNYNELHVFISKSKESLIQAFENGWYPLIIKNRLINKPLIDYYRFGVALGFPECCVKFFREFNNWGKYSYLYEAFKNTPKGQYFYLCNPFTKETGYSYISYMPCAYNCKNTIEFAKRVKNCIREEEPRLVKEIDERLRLPLLVFYEKKFYAFKGVIRKGKIYYKDVYFIGGMQENNMYERDLREGDAVFIENKDVIILKRGKLIKKIKHNHKDFAPEIPFIISFN